MKKLIFALAMIPGSILAHEIPGWEIVNERGDVLKTTIINYAYAGDWCGDEPAAMSLTCDDQTLSLTIESNCKFEPDVRKVSVQTDFPGELFSDRQIVFDVVDGNKTLLRSSAAMTLIFDLDTSDKFLVSLPQRGRTFRDINFDVSGFADAVLDSGMQCMVQHLLR